MCIDDLQTGKSSEVKYSIEPRSRLCAARGVINNKEWAGHSARQRRWGGHRRQRRKRGGDGGGCYKNGVNAFSGVFCPKRTFNLKILFLILFIYLFIYLVPERIYQNPSDVLPKKAYRAGSVEGSRLQRATINYNVLVLTGSIVCKCVSSWIMMSKKQEKHSRLGIKGKSSQPRPLARTQRRQRSTSTFRP